MKTVMFSIKLFFRKTFKNCANIGIEKNDMNLTMCVSVYQCPPVCLFNLGQAVDLKNYQTCVKTCIGTSDRLLGKHCSPI